MKKFIVLSSVLLLILAFGATVYGQEQKLDFRASGFIDAQSLLWRGVTGGNKTAGIINAYASAYQPPVSTAGDAWNRTAHYMESRARLKFDAVMGKELSGTIFFEMDSGSNGATGSGWGDVKPGAINNISDRNSFGYWSMDRAAVEIKNIYFDVALPYIGIPIPMQVRVGGQPLSIRPNLFVYTDGMGIKGGIKIDPVNIEPFWFKALQGKLWADQGNDVYGVHANAKVSGFTLGGYFVYYNLNTYPFSVSTTANIGGVPVTNAGSAVIAGTLSADFWWLGFYADGKAGPVNVNFDFIYDNGKVKSRIFDDLTIDYDGWVVYGKVDYPWEKFNLGAVAYYASGADANKTSASGLPGTKVANPGAPVGTYSTKVKSYVTPPGSEAATNFGESVVFYTTWITRGDTGIAQTTNYDQVSKGPVGGTWMAKLYGSYKATPWFKVTLQGLYIGDTTKHGDTFGASRDAGGDLANHGTIGWESDLITELQIYKNLKFSVGLGAMAPGGAFKFYNTATKENEKPHFPWQLCTNIVYNF